MYMSRSDQLASTGECEVDVVADVVLAQELFEVVATEHGSGGGD